MRKVSDRVDRLNVGHLENQPDEMAEALKEAMAPEAAAEALWEHLSEEAAAKIEQFPEQKEEIWEQTMQTYAEMMKARNG